MVFLGLYILFGLLCFVILLMVEHILALKKFKTEKQDLSYEVWMEKGNALIDYKVIAFLSLFWIVSLSMLALLAVDYMLSNVKSVFKSAARRITGTN